MSSALRVIPFLGLLLGGCVSGTPLRGPDDTVAVETGAIIGTVLSEELIMLTQGVVNLTSLDGTEAPREQNLSDDGRFEFAELAPGAYIVAANVSGFYPREAQVDVEVGPEQSVRLILTPRPTREPHVLVSNWNGFNPCGIALIVTPANMCGSDLAVVTNITSGGVARTGRNYTIPDGFAAVVGETTWNGGEEASAYYYNRSQERKNSNESRSIFSSVLDVQQGKNPLRSFLLPGGQKENSTQGVVAAYYGKVSEGGQFELRYAVWWNGYLGENFGGANAVCNQFAVPRCTGVGATLNFRFTHWMSIFMYERPSDIKAYSVIPDA